MRKTKSPQPLKLNSYKIDNSSLQNNLRQLNQMKSQLQTTISHYKMSESYYIQQNQRLREEVEMLQKKLSQKMQHINCQTKMSVLEEQIDIQREEIQKYKDMYEVQRRNKQEINLFYEKKLDNWQNDSKLLVDNYQQRIASLKSQLNQARSSLLESRTKPVSSGKLHRDISSSNYVSESERSMNTIERKSSRTEQYVIADSKYQPKSLTNVPPKSPNAHLVKNFISEKELQQQSRYPTPQWKYADSKTDPTMATTDEQCFDASIRKLYQEIKEMGISPRQALILPQFRKLKSLRNPSAKDLSVFFKNPPIQQRNSKSIEKNVKYLQSQIKRKYGQGSGNSIAEFLIRKVQEYQEVSQMNSDDLQISGMTPSHGKAQSSYDFSSLSHSNMSKKMIQSKQATPRNLYGSKPSASSENALKIESDGSFLR